MSTEVSSFFSLPEMSFSTLQKEQLFHAFVSRLFLRVGVRWRARVRAGPVVLEKEEKKEKNIFANLDAFSGLCKALLIFT